MRTDFSARQMVKCALCPETIEGRPLDMRANGACKDTRAWYANGNNGRYFALCPEHASIENIREQFGKLGV